MEVLFQLGLGILMICAVVFIAGIIQLIASKGKSKIGLRMVLISTITFFVVIAIGFGTCIYALNN